MAISHNTEFAEQLCNVFGLDPEKTHSITIKIAPDDVVRVEVLQFLLTDEGDELIKIFSSYHLTENEIGTDNDE